MRDYCVDIVLYFLLHGQGVDKPGNIIDDDDV
jgi:hypothetical protein